MRRRREELVVSSEVGELTDSVQYRVARSVAQRLRLMHAVDVHVDRNEGDVSGAAELRRVLAIADRHDLGDLARTHARTTAANVQRWDQQRLERSRRNR